MPDFQQLVRVRLRDSGLPPAREAEIIDELSEHLRQRYLALCSTGSGEEHALKTIIAELDLRDLAAELRLIEQSRSEPVALGAPNPPRFWTAVGQDLRYALRVLRLNPAFTAVCVLSLALGIGANTAIFQLIDSVRMRTLPVKNPEELAVIRSANLSRSGHITGRYSYTTNAMWEQIRAHQQAFTGVFAWGNDTLNLSAGGQAHNADALWASGEFFDVLGVQPLLGRVFHAADDQAGCGTPGAVLSYGFWQREFGGDPNITSRTVGLENHVFPIFGVTPASFTGVDVGHTFDVAIPICSEPVIMGERSLYNVRHGWWLAVMGRLKPGWSLEKASAQLATISPGIMQESLPTAYSPDRAKRYLEMKLAAFPGATGLSDLRRAYESPLWLLLAIAGLVLLIACANLANLMLARAGTREREIAVRLALGAARGRLVRQLLTESLMIAIAGAAVGMALAAGLTRLLVNYLSGRIYISLSIDWRVLGFTTALAVLTCILFGLAPAMKATSAPPARVMSLAGRSTATRERFSLRRALVVLQVALSLVLVVTAILFSSSLRKILSIDAGFQRDGLLVMDVDFTRLNLPSSERVPFAESLLERVRALPGVEGAAETSTVPLGDNWWNDYVVVDGKRIVKNVNMSRVTPGYFKTMGTPLLAGRDFDQHDIPGSPQVAIVSQEFARQILGTEDPIGRTFKIDVYKGEAQPEYQIVGLVKGSKYTDLREDLSPLAYYPLAKDGKPDNGTEMMIRSSLSLEPLLESLRHAIAEQNPAITIDFHVLNQDITRSLLRERLLATLSGFFGLLAAVLATVGLYGVIAYLVVRRTNEIGIRMALGATPGRILRMVVGEAAFLLSIGIAIGCVLALSSGKLAATLLYGLKPYDPLVFVVAATGLAAIAVAASLLPARRAAHLEPTVALREE